MSTKSPGFTLSVLAVGVVMGLLLSWLTTSGEDSSAPIHSPSQHVVTRATESSGVARPPGIVVGGSPAGGMTLTPPSDAPGTSASGTADGDDTSAPLSQATAARCRYALSPLLCRFIDIDFIEFVISSQPHPGAARVVDIGIYQAGELIRMASVGFKIAAFEPNPYRHKACQDEIDRQSPAVKDRIDLKMLAVSDDTRPMNFQLGGLDSHMYIVDNNTQIKEKSIVVQVTPISAIVTKDTYFVKVDTQGFDTRIVDSLLTHLAATPSIAVQFIQFEFSPWFETTRSKRSAADHKAFFRRLMDAGYDVYMGAAVQPWRQGYRSPHGRRNPLAMLAVDRSVPTCVDAFVDHMHAGKERPIFRGKSTTEIGTWMDILAVRRVDRTPYFRHTGWVLSRHM